jgi:colicin import membrane protein
MRRLLSRWWSAWWLGVGLTTLVWPARATEQSSEAAAQRARIEHERAAIEAQYEARQQQCASRFVVTACVDRAKAERRQALAPLERSLSALDEAQRRRRAAERLQRIEQKSQSQATGENRPLAPEKKRKPAPGMTRLEVPAPGAGPAPAPKRRLEAPKPGAVEAYERRQREAAEHRDAVQRRNLERESQRRPAAPLGPPTTSGN